MTFPDWRKNIDANQKHEEASRQKNPTYADAEARKESINGIVGGDGSCRPC